MTEITDSQLAAAIEYATAEGKSAGEDAASWYFDGNTTESTYRAVLTAIEDSDPAILETFPYPDLSGQWADKLTGPDLVSDALQLGIDQDAGECFTDICDAYDDAFNVAVYHEIERVARLQLS